jgi:RNA-directed DNA polymerase
VFEKITSFENLLSAYYGARKNKRHKRRLQQFELDFEDRLVNIRQCLQDGRYSPKKYHRFLVYEPKTRQISAPAFVDRIVHHAIVSVIEPVFEAKFIENTFACRAGKGTHFGVKQINRCYQTLARDHEIFFVLKCDIKSYFASINHRILTKFLFTAIPCPRTRRLLETIINSYEDSPDCGIPIGNLTSQLFANIYLHPLDIYITKKLKEKNYFRYMDDFLVISENKDYLIALRTKMRDFLQAKLKLNLHPKKANIFRGDRGLDFLGYLIKRGSITLRNKTLRRYKKRHKRRLTRLARWKQELKVCEQTKQLALFENTAKDNKKAIYLAEKIKGAKIKLFASRNSFKGFLKYSSYEKLTTGGVNVDGIIVPKIFRPRKKNLIHDPFSSNH